MELAKQIHTLRPALPIVLCSGYANLARRENLEAAGIRLLVEKPYSVEQLADAMARALKLVGK
jgi:CheY-like chemotaxis protein